MPQYLETTVDKFTFRVAIDRFYTPHGVWVKLDPATTRVRIGLADYPQQHNGDVAFARVKSVGTQVTAGAVIAEIETIKAMIEVATPISGTLVEVNASLDAAPEAINQSPYEAGWLAMIEPSAWEAERPKLLAASGYFAVMQAQVQEDLKHS